MAASRRHDQVPAVDVRVLDHLVALVERLGAVAHDGLHVVLRRASRRGAGVTREPHRLGRVLARERRPARRPASRSSPPAASSDTSPFAGALVAVDHDHAQLAIGSAPPRALRGRPSRPGRRRDDRDLRRDAHREARHDEQFRPLLAAEDVPLVAVLDRLSDRHVGAADRQLDRRHERRRPERQPERRVRVELVAGGVRQRAPVGRRQARARPGSSRPRRSAASPRRLDHRGRADGSPSKPDSEIFFTARSRRAAVGHDRLHAHRLPGEHHAVVGQHVDADALRQDGRALELVLLELQPVSISNRAPSSRLSEPRRDRSARTAPRPATIGSLAASGPCDLNAFCALST